MAGDWIKMRGNLWDDPRVAALVDATETSEAAVIGGLYWLWATADQHTEDGVLPGLSLRQIDRKTGIAGLGQALCDVGWLSVQQDGVTVAKFSEHNGVSAKSRAVDAKRKASGRNLSGSDPDRSRTTNGNAAEGNRQNAELEKEKEKEKRREEIPEDPNGSLSASPPVGQQDFYCEPGKPLTASPAEPVVPCPIDALIDAYEELLPTLPQVRRSLFKEGKRADAMRQRWRWVMTAKHERGDRAGQRLAVSVADGVQWFRKYFSHAAGSDFLTGRDGRWTGCDLGFLMNKSRFEGVLEGKYHKAEIEHA